MANLILPVPYSNPSAQPWRLPSFEAPRVNINWKYGPRFVIPAASTAFNQQIVIHGNIPFLCRELAFDIGLVASPGAITIRLKDGTGKKMSGDMLAVEELQGPLPIDWLIENTTQIFADISNAMAVDDITVQVILKGVELYQPLGINTCMPGFEPEQYIGLHQMYSIPPEGWHDEPFDYYFELANTASASKSYVLKMDDDADFYWRGVGGGSTGPGRSRLQFFDAWQNQLNALFVQQDNALGVAPLCRPFLPEVCCPANSTLTVEGQEYLADTTTLKLALRGVKRFRN